MGKKLGEKQLMNYMRCPPRLVTLVRKIVLSCLSTGGDFLLIPRGNGMVHDRDSLRLADAGQAFHQWDESPNEPVAQKFHGQMKGST